jgi:hypothetical protein
MQLARFMADLEPRHNETADLMFAGRFDVQHDRDAMAYAAKSFNILPFVSRRRGAVGWPHGCNELWFDLMAYCRERIVAGHLPPYKAILTMEGDCVPLKKDWVAQMHRVWDEERPPTAFCAGTLLAAPAEHINGNAMWSAAKEDLEFLQRIGGASPDQGWDYQHAGLFKNRGWHATDKITSYWNMKTCDRQTFENLYAGNTALFHGCKDMTLLALARQKMIGSSGLGYRVNPPKGQVMRVKW